MKVRTNNLEKERWSMLDNNEVVIYPKLTKLIFLAFCGIIFVIIGVSITIGGMEAGKQSLFWVSFGVSAIVFFCICLMYLVYRIFNRKPSVIINDYAIVDNSSYINGGTIQWSEISDVSIHEYMSQRFIGIQLHNPEKLLRNAKWI